MSNSNTNLQTQSSNALHNAIMEAGSKDRPPMLAPGNYVQWKSKYQRYIDTKLDSELINIVSINPPLHITISTPVDACPNACEMWKAIERLKQGDSIMFDLETQFTMGVWKNSHYRMVNHLNRILPVLQLMKSIVLNQCHVTNHKVNVQFLLHTYNQNGKIDVNEIRAERMARIANPLRTFQEIYKPTNNKPSILSSNTVELIKIILQESTEETGYDNQRAINVAGPRENVANWKDDTDDGLKKQELEAHYMYMAQLQEVTPDPVDNSGPIFDDEPMHKLVELILFIVDSGCSKNMTGNLKLLTNFVEKFLGTVKFGNDQIAPILGYIDLVQGTITIKRVYYVKGLNHNLFFIGQFCDADLEVAFWKSTCYIRDLKGNDSQGSRGTDLYSQ
ncbi:hypothetical protein Tco_0553682 [Tanacetum coccineum]